MFSKDKEHANPMMKVIRSLKSISSSFYDMKQDAAVVAE